VIEMKSTQSLLIVDDEDNIVSALKRLLRRDGYEILTAASAEEGLAVLESYGAAVVISDQRMPGMNGAEFLREVKRRYPNTVRIMLTGHSQSNVLSESLKCRDICRLLTKPWDDYQLRASVRSAFREYSLFRDRTRPP